LVKLLLDRGASTSMQNEREETPIDVVSGAWNEEMSRFYHYLNEIGDLGLDMNQIKQSRPKILNMLRETAADKE
jgi:hypothetical protein